MTLVALTAPAEAKGCIKDGILPAIMAFSALLQVAQSVTTRRTSSKKLSPARRGMPCRLRPGEATEDAATVGFDFGTAAPPLYFRPLCPGPQTAVPATAVNHPADLER